MAKWYGVIGFAEQIETEPGIWEERVTERSFRGDVINNRWKRQTSGEVLDNINISNQISIIANPYINDHCSSIVYVEFMGAKWKVTDVEVQYPRLLLSIGGVWNGN